MWERLREKDKELERDEGDEKRKTERGERGGSIDRMTDRQINTHDPAVSIDVACC